MEDKLKLQHQTVTVTESFDDGLTTVTVTYHEKDKLMWKRTTNTMKKGRETVVVDTFFSEEEAKSE
jgi:uncharacterized protein YbaP (TraB family)